MTAEEINRAIAEHVGWAWYAVEKAGWYYRQGGCGYTNRIEEAGRYTKEAAEKELVRGEPMGIVQIPHPNYSDDLNAMHEAEKAAFGSSTLWVDFAHHLLTLLGAFELPVKDGIVCGLQATATQRAEALLRTIGKWRNA